MSNLTELNGIQGYLARPAGEGPWPGLIVIQEWWGLDAQTIAITERFAGIGYLAFSPDLFHGELAQLGDSQKAMTLTQKYSRGAPAELEKVFDGLKSRPDCSGKVGSVGFCYGGRMSLALGLSRPLDAVCTFYGGGMQQIFDQMSVLKAPVLGMFGDADVSIPPGTIQEFEKILEKLGLEHTIVVYPNSGHAFFRDSDPSVYRPEASKDAWERATGFFGKYLR